MATLKMVLGDRGDNSVIVPCWPILNLLTYALGLGSSTPEVWAASCVLLDGFEYIERRPVGVVVGEGNGANSPTPVAVKTERVRVMVMTFALLVAIERKAGLRYKLHVGWAGRYDHETINRTDALVAELLASIT